MKKTILFLAISLMSNLIFAQDENLQVNYNEVNENGITRGSFQSYVAKDGSVFKVGDRVNFKTPSGTNGRFVSITKVMIDGSMYPVGSELVNSSSEIKKIRVGGNKRSGYKVTFQTKGYTGIDNYFLYIEDAISMNEVKSLVMSSEEALANLKKEKDKMDLGLITPQEFEARKKELTPYIK